MWCVSDPNGFQDSSPHIPWFNLQYFCCFPAMQVCVLCPKHLLQSPSLRHCFWPHNVFSSSPLQWSFCLFDEAGFTIHAWNFIHYLLLQNWWLASTLINACHNVNAGFECCSHSHTFGGMLDLFWDTLYMYIRLKKMWWLLRFFIVPCLRNYLLQVSLDEMLWYPFFLKMCTFHTCR